ncbi:hypothetical protein [Viridibacillus arvi]|nr:hypothetical protein [Viridibacillus arvi]
MKYGYARVSTAGQGNSFRDANKELEIIKIESKKWIEKLNIHNI